MGSFCTKQKNSVGIQTHNQNEKDKQQSPNPKYRSLQQNPQENTEDKSEKDDKLPEWSDDYDMTSDSEDDWSTEEQDMGEVLVEAPISPKSPESEKPKDRNRKNKMKECNKAPYVKKGAPRYPGTGSSFSIRPLTPEKPQTVTVLSTINPTKENVIS